MGRGGHADHAGEETTVLQSVQKQPCQQKVAQVVHDKVLLKSIHSSALGNYTRFRDTKKPQNQVIWHMQEQKWLLLKVLLWLKGQKLTTRLSAPGYWHISELERRVRFVQSCQRKSGQQTNRSSLKALFQKACSWLFCTIFLAWFHPFKNLSNYSFLYWRLSGGSLPPGLLRTAGVELCRSLLLRKALMWTLIWGAVNWRFLKLLILSSAQRKLLARLSLDSPHKSCFHQPVCTVRIR